MDLYRILRQSLYLMVGSGAFSLAIAEQNLWYLIAAVIFGVLASELLDTGRFKPAQREFVAALTLALFVYNLMIPLREENGWERHYPAAFAHFLFSFQILLLFTGYSDWVLILVGISTLAIVLISGAIDHNATLILRIGCFVALTAWTLFIHSLWRSRENFASTQKVAARHQTQPNSELSRDLSEKALLQGVSMTAVLSFTCLTLGLVLFFSAPRLDRISAWFEFLTLRRDAQKNSRTSPFRSNGNDAVHTGFSNSVDLNNLGPINENQGEALAITLSKFTKELGDSNGSIYLRGAAMSEHIKGKWISAKRYGKTYEAEKDKPILLEDPSTPGITYNRPMIVQTIESLNLYSRHYFAVAPAARLMVPRVELDVEGTMHVPASQEMEKYQVWSYPPRRASFLAPDAKAEHPDRATYVKEHGLSPAVEADVRAKALEITSHSTTALEKVYAIQAYLHDSGRYSYTLKLDELTRSVDPVAEFLLNPDPSQRRGHCGYFASAFVILCRLNDIPARLATGFCARLPDAPEDDSVRLVFKNSDAHAWGEVYFKDYGWIVFDPTPARAEQPETKIAKTSPPPPSSAKPPAGKPDWSIEDVWKRGIIEYGTGPQDGIYGKIGEAVGGAGEILSGNSAGGWFGALLAWACTGIFMYWLMQLYLRRGRTRVGRGSGAGGRPHAAISFYNDLLQVLSRRGFVRRPGQTPREFAEYVVRMGGDQFKSVMLVTDVFEGVRYGGAEMSQEEFNNLQNALDGLRELTFASAATAAKS